LAIGYNRATKVDKQAAQRIRNLPQDEWHEGDDFEDEMAEGLADDVTDNAAAPDVTWAEALEIPLRSYIQMPELPDKLENLGLPLLSYLTIRVISQTVAGVTINQTIEARVDLFVSKRSFGWAKPLECGGPCRRFASPFVFEEYRNYQSSGLW
jgi:hypothetical protein